MVVASKKWLDHEAVDTNIVKEIIMSEQVLLHPMNLIIPTTVSSAPVTTTITSSTVAVAETSTALPTTTTTTVSSVVTTTDDNNTTSLNDGDNCNTQNSIINTQQSNNIEENNLISTTTTTQLNNKINHDNLDDIINETLNVLDETNAKYDESNDGNSTDDEFQQETPLQSPYPSPSPSPLPPQSQSQQLQQNHSISITNNSQTKTLPPVSGRQQQQQQPQQPQQQQQQQQQQDVQQQKNATNNTNKNVQPIEKPGSVRVILTCQPNSHPFFTRNIILEPKQEIKVGRSITRNRISENNAIFDCKVLSRNHALLWMANGKYYIRDTASSNGTFVNNNRLSLTATLSKPFEVKSGDIVQFGVDVLENTRKETHGCIMAELKFFAPHEDWKRLVGSVGLTEISVKAGNHPAGARNLPLADLFRLNAYIQEAAQREQILEIKLLNLQKIIELIRKTSADTWQSMIEEDRLLSRIDILENKLQYFQKNVTDDKLRKEILKLQDDKSVYQNSAKEALRKVHQERNDAVQKLSTIERALCSSEDECALLRDQLLKTQKNFEDVTAMLTEFEEKNYEWHIQSEQYIVREQAQKNDLRQLLEQVKKKNLEVLALENQLSHIQIEHDHYKSRVDAFDRLNDEVSGVCDDGIIVDGGNVDIIDVTSADSDEETTADSSNKFINHILSKTTNNEFKASIQNKQISPGQKVNEFNKQEKLIEIEKHLSALEDIQLKIIKINGNDDLNISLASDGNQNNENDTNKNGITNIENYDQISGSTTTTASDQSINETGQNCGDDENKNILKSTISQMIDMNKELRAYIQTFDFVKYQDLESQLSFCILQIKQLQNAHPTVEAYQEKLNECNQLRHELIELQYQVQMNSVSLNFQQYNHQTNGDEQEQQQQQQHHLHPISQSLDNNESNNQTSDDKSIKYVDSSVQTENLEIVSNVFDDEITTKSPSTIETMVMKQLLANLNNSNNKSPSTRSNDNNEDDDDDDDDDDDGVYDDDDGSGEISQQSTVREARGDSDVGSSDGSCSDNEEQLAQTSPTTTTTTTVATGVEEDASSISATTTTTTTVQSSPKDRKGFTLFNNKNNKNKNRNERVQIINLNDSNSSSSSSNNSNNTSSNDDEANINTNKIIENNKSLSPSSLSSSSTTNDSKVIVNISSIIIENNHISDKIQLAKDVNVVPPNDNDSEKLTTAIITREDLQMLTDPDIQREEELITFKEECRRLVTNNLEMKMQINELKAKLNQGTQMVTSLLYAAPFVAIIGYLLISPYL